MSSEIVHTIVDEIEALEAIYGPENVHLRRPQAFKKLKGLVESHTSTEFDCEDCGIYIEVPFTDLVNETEVNVKINVDFPPDYPHQPCTTSISSAALGRQAEIKCNSELARIISEEFLGQEQVLPVVLWLQENVFNYVTISAKECEEVPSQESVPHYRCGMRFHHIYSKKKIAGIRSNVQQLKLNGVMLTGKPGVMCVEGEKTHVLGFVEYLRNLHWQKMTVVEQKAGTFQHFDRFTHLGPDEVKECERVFQDAKLIHEFYDISQIPCPQHLREEFEATYGIPWHSS
eukprot:GCRY01006800.1.p1 GENE.GCRY01006800.1~~GCRY01006800.1.p1  ORF type:complete len:294 (+),score=43.15 GCRY01006800.1:22-882(+)